MQGYVYNNEYNPYAGVATNVTLLINQNKSKQGWYGAIENQFASEMDSWKCGIDYDINNRLMPQQSLSPITTAGPTAGPIASEPLI